MLGQRVVREWQRKRLDERRCVITERRPLVVDGTYHGCPIAAGIAMLAVHVEVDAAARFVELPDTRIGLAALAQVDAPVVAVYLWINVGSVDEPAGMDGAAHVVEHMVFKGTTSYGVGEVSGAVEAVGGDLNAWTSF